MGIFANMRDQLNPLSWPFVVATLAYGIGFTFFNHTAGVGASSLHAGMTQVAPHAPVFWGIACLVAVALAAAFFVLDYTPGPKAAGLLGAVLWLFALFCWLLTGGWLLIFAVAVPNLWFWTWVFLQPPGHLTPPDYSGKLKT